MKRAGIRAVLLLLVFGAGGVRGDPPRTGVEATSSFWCSLVEEVENGLTQPGSGDPAAGEASGFNFRQGRLAFQIQSLDGKVAALVRLRLEERTDVLGFWGAYRHAPWLQVAIGQMKIPATGEVLRADHQLDFISRTTFGRNLCDYALARTPYNSSIMAIKSYDRDLGLQCSGDLPVHGRGSLAWRLMVANGLGGNRYVGGSESREFLYTNRFGDFYYGGRRVELGVRHDTFTSRLQRDANETSQRNWTYGVNLRPHESVRLQLNYVTKRTVDVSVPDLDDDILFLNVQFAFATGLLR